MSLKHAILGFLSFNPLSGYDLKKAFDNSVSHFWPANQSQIYRTLAQMTDAGLLEIEVLERDERLDMKLYHITATGQEELQKWLATPLPLQASREPLLVQIFFSSRLDDEKILTLLRHETQVTQDALEIYDEIYNANAAKEADDPRAFFLSMLTLDYGRKANQIKLEWLNKAIQQIETKTYDPAQL